MPSIKQPNTDVQRLAAMEAAKLKADATAPADLAFSAANLALLIAFLPTFRTQMQQRGSALSAQTASTGLVETLRIKLKLFVTHFIEVFNRGILREVYTADQRGHFQIAVSNSNLPHMVTDQEITLWAERIVTGDAARVTAGGAAMSNPTAAEVDTQRLAYLAAQGVQTTKKDAFDSEQEDVQELRDDADALIKDIWDEVEFTFRHDAPPSKRRKAREYGVVYLPAKGETLSPSDFSITGTIADTQTGAAVSDVSVKVVETGEITMSDGSGKYFVSALTPGTYSLLLQKAGYPDTTVSGIVVTSTAVTTRNISFGGVITIEGDLGNNVTFGYNASGINASPTSNVIAEISGNMVGISAADTLAGGPGPVEWMIPMGTANKTAPEFGTLIGADGSKKYFHFHNPGPFPAHYKLTITNLLP